MQIQAEAVAVLLPRRRRAAAVTARHLTVEPGMILKMPARRSWLDSQRGAVQNKRQKPQKLQIRESVNFHQNLRKNPKVLLPLPARRSHPPR